uniref:BTB domain-containing protein n=1 Tax=Romanomermis culicivorax TaxID=13658 RepID=A0A915IYU4_ROMCU
MSSFLSPSAERNLCLLVDKVNDGDYHDEEIWQEKVKIWVSKGLLAAVSPVFNTMFNGDFRESQLSTTNEPINLPGKNDQDFLKFLNCLFPYSTQSDIDESNVETILRLSDEYQVEYLMKKCDQFYERHGANETRAVLTEIFGRSQATVWPADGIARIRIDLLEFVILSRCYMSQLCCRFFHAIKKLDFSIEV